MLNRPWGGLVFAGVCALWMLGGNGVERSAAGGGETVGFRGVAGTDGSGEARLDASGRTATPSAAAATEEQWILTELRQSVAAMGRNEVDAAKVGFRKVLEARPDNVTALVNMGWIAQREKSWSESESYMRRAVRLAPENPAVWLALGISVLEQGMLEHAMGAFSQVVAFDSANARGHRLLGLTLARKGWYSGAEEELRRSLELEPTDAGAHYNLAVLYLQRRPLAVELARRHYYRAVDLGAEADPAIEEALSESAVAEAEPKQRERSVSVSER